MYKILVIIAALLVAPHTVPGTLGDINTVSYDLLEDHDRKQVDCLAANIYHEARGQSTKGQVAVGLVTMNRVESGLFPDTVCGVIKQKRSGVCQFSWWCDSNARAILTSAKAKVSESRAYEEIRALSTWLYFHHNRLEDVTHGALFYHATHASPGWRGVKRTTRIGDHVFYRKQ